ncbi:MAG: hypothetical protein ACE5FQ_16040 [Thiogranum sp.]
MSNCRAMQAFLRQKEGAGLDLFRDLLWRELWQALRLSPTSSVTRRTLDSERAPWTGYGLMHTRDDIARIANFLNVDHGAINGEQVLAPNMLDSALQRLPGVQGLAVTGAAGTYYNKGFWAFDARAWFGCTDPLYIPFMSGIGGIIVALIPNGASYYYFSDSNEFSWVSGAAETARILPVANCAP